MSNQHLTAVSRADFKLTSLPARHRMAAKSVMKVFADYANHHDKSWPHVSTIALEAGCGPDTVSTATEACVKANLLRKRKTRAGNKYVINMKLLKEIEVPRPKRRDPDMPEFDDTDLHENQSGEPSEDDGPDQAFSEEPKTPGQGRSGGMHRAFSEEPETPSDQGFSEEPKTYTGSSENRFRLIRSGFSEEPTQIPYGSPTDPPRNPYPAQGGEDSDLFGNPAADNDRTPAADSKQDPSSRFEEFWSEVIRKEDRKKALTAFTAAVKAGTDPDTIIEGMRRYVRLVQAEKRERRFIKTPAAWLNGSRWADEFPELNGSTGTDGPQPSAPGPYRSLNQSAYTTGGGNLWSMA